MWTKHKFQIIYPCGQRISNVVVNDLAGFRNVIPNEQQTQLASMSEWIDSLLINCQKSNPQKQMQFIIQIM